MYDERPSTASKAGHRTALRLILCAPPLAYSDVSWVKDTIPRKPSGQIAPHSMSVLLAILKSLVEYLRASSILLPTGTAPQRGRERSRSISQFVTK